MEDDEIGFVMRTDRKSDSKAIIMMILSTTCNRIPIKQALGSVRRTSLSSSKSSARLNNKLTDAVKL